MIVPAQHAGERNICFHPPKVRLFRKNVILPNTGSRVRTRSPVWKGSEPVAQHRCRLHPHGHASICCQLRMTARKHTKRPMNRTVLAEDTIVMGLSATVCLPPQVA